MMPISSFETDPQDPLLYFRHQSDELTNADSAEEKLSPQTYIQHINVMFRDFTTMMADHDVALSPQDMLQDYHASSSEVALFTPTALRQLHHYYANYVQSLHFLSHPTFDYHGNKQDLTRDDPNRQNDLIHHLSHNLQQTHEAIHIFRNHADTTGKPQVQEQFDQFHERLTALTQQFCVDNQIDILQYANQNVSAPANGHKPTPKIG